MLAPHAHTYTHTHKHMHTHVHTHTCTHTHTHTHTQHTQVSPPMPSYLVAWVVGRLGSVNRSCETPFASIPVAVWSSPNKCVVLWSNTFSSCGHLWRGALVEHMRS